MVGTAGSSVRTWNTEPSRSPGGTWIGTGMKTHKSPQDRGLEGNLAGTVKYRGANHSRSRGGLPRLREGCPAVVLRRASYFVLPLTVKWARRFFCQHSSVDCWQTGTSLP